MTALFTRYWETYPLYTGALTFILAFGVCSFFILLFISAPYGRHYREGWGPSLPAKWGWMIMEAPSPICFVVVFVMFEGWKRPPALVLAGLYLLHYIYRSFIFPFRMRGADKPKPFLTTGLAFVFNICNGSCNAFAIAALGAHLTSDWFFDPRFAIGIVVFALGYFWNQQSDSILRNLRAPGETGYKIPYGGLYRFVSSPNYLGEIIEWTGFAIAAWTFPAAAFAFFTACNLVPRGVSNHKWYLENFADYPKERRAVLPFIW